MHDRSPSSHDLAASLARAPFRPLGEFDPPSAGGLYAIKLAPGAWAGTSLACDDRTHGPAVAYVGKAEGSGRGIAKRWLNEHLAAHSGRSSPRRSWLAVLAPAWNLAIYPRPCQPGNQPNVHCFVADRDGELRLRDWIERNYRVGAVQVPTTDLTRMRLPESRAMALLQPFANCGTPHPLWTEVFDPGRKALIAEARQRVRAGDLLDLAHHRGQT